MSTTPLLPAVVTTIDDDGGQRITDRPYRLMYVTKTIADAVDRSQLRPDPAPPLVGRTTRRPTVARTHRARHWRALCIVTWRSVARFPATSMSP